MFTMSGFPDPGSREEAPKGLLQEMAPHLALKRKRKASSGLQEMEEPGRCYCQLSSEEKQATVW